MVESEGILVESSTSNFKGISKSEKRKVLPPELPGAYIVGKREKVEAPRQ